MGSAATTSLQRILRKTCPASGHYSATRRFPSCSALDILCYSSIGCNLSNTMSGLAPILLTVFSLSLNSEL